MVYLGSYGVSGDGEGKKASHVAFGDVCFLGDLKGENESGIETVNGTASDPWDPTEPGCHIVHSD